MTEQQKTLIIGAGLAGLAAAYRLKRGYRLIEKLDKPGGLCETISEDGFRFDRTGHLLHLRQGRIRRLILGLLDQEPEQITRRSRIFSHGVYTHYPFQANIHGLPTEVVAECLLGFLEAAARKKTVTRKPATFEEFISMHFGAGIARHFMIPYNAKLWGVHPSKITSDWCKRFVPIPTTEEVVHGALGMPQDRMGYNTNFLYPRNGIEELPAALARKVGAIEYRTRPTRIDFRRRRLLIRGGWVPYRAVISTMPLKSLVALLDDPPSEILEAGSRLRCSSLRYLDVALNKKSRTDYHWTYVPERKYPFYRVGCYSNFSKSMAPPGKSNLYVELASRRSPDMRALMPRIAEGLIDMGIIKRASDIAFTRQRRITFSYVIYDHSYTKSVPKLLSWLERQRIFSAGRYARWEYSAMEDALNQGFDAADKVKDLD